MRIVNLHRRIAASKIDLLLLDEFPGASTGHSLRYLTSSFSGNVVIVRRSSDDEEQGFTIEEINNGDLVSFVGSSDGHVKTWYDQTGNYDFGQTILSRQPKIVENGSLVKNNGFPSIKFSGGQFLGLATPDLFENEMAVFNVVQVTNTSSETRAWVFSSPLNSLLLHRNYTNLNQIRAFVQTNVASELSFPFSDWNDIHLFYMSAVSDDYMEARLNNQSLQSQSINSFVNTTINNRFGVGAGRTETTNNITGHVFETITYNEQKSSVYNQIISKINQFYNVF